MTDTEPSAITYEELAELEHEFDDLDAEILRKQYVMSSALYAKRQTIVSKIPSFWSLVLESAPPEIDAYIQPSDSEIFARCLTDVDVKRFEIPLGPERIEQDAQAGDPRSILIRFDFAENEWFEDTVLEKRFWWRRSRDGWTGLVSEPVRVHWKKGKDLTHGLMDGAIELWEARKKAGDMGTRDLPEFDSLARLLENWNGANTSFFTWFAHISSRRWVSADESAEATKAEKERRQKVASGETQNQEAAPLPDDDSLEQQVEVHDDGEALANVIAEDLWPGAIKYFTQSQEDVDMSEADFEEDEEDDGTDGDDTPIDIRDLVRPRPETTGQTGSTPNKRQKQR